MLRYAIFALLPLLTVGCGGDSAADDRSGDSAAAAKAPAAPDLNALLPADADVIVRLASLKHLTDVLEQAAAAAQQPLPGDPIALLAMQMRVAVDQLDRTRPCAVAVTMPKEAPFPVMTFVVPVKDPDAVLAAYAAPGKAKQGTYVALSQMPEYKPGASKLAADLPDGDVVVRVDLAGLIAKYGKDVDRGVRMLSRMPRALTGRKSDTVAQAAQDAVASAERLDVVVRADEDITIDFAFVTKEGSPLATRPVTKSGLPGLAASLPADVPVSMLFSFDLLQLLDGMDVAEEDRPKLEQVKAAFKGLGEDWLFAVDLNEDGAASLLVAGRVTDGGAEVLAQIEREIAALDEAKVTGRTKVDGVDVIRIEVEVDEKAKDQATKLFGGPTVPVDLAVHDGRILCSVGHDMKQVLAAKAVPAMLKASLARVPGEVAFHLRANLRALAASGKAAEFGLPMVAALPAAVELIGTRDGRVYRASLRVTPAVKQAAVAEDK